MPIRPAPRWSYQTATEGWGAVDFEVALREYEAFDRTFEGVAFRAVAGVPFVLETVGLLPFFPFGEEFGEVCGFVAGFAGGRVFALVPDSVD